MDKGPTENSWGPDVGHGDGDCGFEGKRIAPNSWRSPDKIMTRTPRRASAACIAARTIDRSARKPPQVSEVPKRQFLVNGTEEAIIFQWTLAGSGVER
jgi:hypothetical protein